MRLLQFPDSPFAAKVRIYLAAKHLAFEVADVPYLDRREVVALTGKVMVPVLVDGPTVVEDSAAITAYLDDRYLPSLRGALGVIVEQWADGPLEDAAFRLACPGLEARLGLNDAGREAEARALYRLMKERRFGAGCVTAWKRDEATYSAQVRRLLEPLVQVLATHPFLQGGAFSLADAAVAGQLFMIEAAHPGWVQQQVPGLAGWYERVAPTSSSPSSRE